MRKKVLSSAVTALLLLSFIVAPVAVWPTVAHAQDDNTSNDNSGSDSDSADDSSGSNDTSSEDEQHAAEAAAEQSKHLAEQRREAAKHRLEEIEQKRSENKSEREQKTDEQKREAFKKACEERRENFKNRLEQLGERTAKQSETMGTISERVQAYVEKNNLTVENYDSLLAAVATQKTVVSNLVEATKQAAEGFDCGNDQDTAKANLATFKDALKQEIAALKEYKTALKNLITAVKAAQGDTSNDN